MKRSKHKLPCSQEQVALDLIRQVAAPTFDDPEYWQFGERGDILLRLHRLGPVTRKVWLDVTFPDADRTRLAVWACTALGKRVLDDRISVLANLPRNATNQDLANLLVEYSLMRFGNPVVDGMSNDARDANGADLGLGASNA